MYNGIMKINILKTLHERLSWHSRALQNVLYISVSWFTLESRGTNSDCNVYNVMIIYKIKTFSGIF